MRLAIVDCRSLIQFCKAFHPHNPTTPSRGRTRRFNPNSLNPFSNHLCNHSPLAALDFIILLIVLASLAFLILPYFKFFFCELLPILNGFIIDLILDDPLPYFIGFFSVLIGVILALIVDTRLRKCGNPHCKGLRRAVEYDIQLETENCVKYSPPHLDAYLQNNGATPLELGQDREELEAELKKMAPLNGRTVLIFRSPCGCPAGRLEEPMGRLFRRGKEKKDKGSMISSCYIHCQKGENIAEDIETLSREELGRRVASRWTWEKTGQHEEFDASIDKNHEFPDEMPIEINDEENNGYASDDDEHRYDDDDDSEDQVDDFGGEDQYDSSSSQKPESNDEFDLSDIIGTSDSSWLDKIQKKVKSIFQAAHVRQEYDESSSKLSEIQSRISSLKQKLKQDFGPDKEFYSLYGQCFESKQNKYVYKVCPFKEATQVEGYSTTRLGYLALLSTPALCLDSKLKELQDKLESLNKDRPQAPRT